MNTTPAKVLIIEDEKQIRRFVRVAVEEEGCLVSEAETMSQGLLEAGSRKPDRSLLAEATTERISAECVSTALIIFTRKVRKRRLAFGVLPGESRFSPVFVISDQLLCFPEPFTPW